MNNAPRQNTVPGFRNEELTDMVAIGSVSADAARIWVRSRRPGELVVKWWSETDDSGGELHFCVVEGNSTDNTAAIDLPGKGGKPLEPLNSYHYEVHRADSGEPVGAGRFETAPGSNVETPSKFSIALISCHQPFDASGVVRNDARAMLQAMIRILRENNTKLVLMIGDQMYSDYPPELSLLNDRYFPQVAPPGRGKLQDCTPGEVRTLYQQRYRLFWNIPEWKVIQAEWPCYMIWDDHDIIDNWGSDPAHQRTPWLSVGEGARQAYYDYQGSRVLPTPHRNAFHYSIEYGSLAIFLMDIRAERRAGKNGRLFSDEQEADFQAFLNRHRTKPVVFVVLTVPIFQLSQFLTRMFARITPSGEDFSDRWSTGTHVRDRDRMLGRIHAHQLANPHQRVVLLSGDIHIGCAHEFRWKDMPLNPLYQLISSGITHASSRFVAGASELLIRMNRKFATEDGKLAGRFQLLAGSGDLRRNPFGELNMGLVEIDHAELRYSLFGHRTGIPVRVFRSHPISCNSPTAR